MRIIAGRWRGHRIQVPPGGRTRPTADRVREAWMSMLQPELVGARVLDLFAGSGALGLEALSRGAAHVTFVERADAAVRALRANLRKLGAESESEAVIMRGDALAYVRRLDAAEFDIGLADPPYGAGCADALLRAFERVPFARWLWIEHAVGDPVPELSGARHRRYGDTVLTSIRAPEPTQR